MKPHLIKLCCLTFMMRQPTTISFTFAGVFLGSNKHKSPVSFSFKFLSSSPVPPPAFHLIFQATKGRIHIGNVAQVFLYSNIYYIIKKTVFNELDLFDWNGHTN